MYYTSLLTYEFMVQHAAFTIGFDFFYHTVQSEGTAVLKTKISKICTKFLRHTELTAGNEHTLWLYCRACLSD